MKGCPYFNSNIFNILIDFRVIFTVGPRRRIATIKIQNEILCNHWIRISFKSKILQIFSEIRTNHWISIPWIKNVYRILVLSKVIKSAIFSTYISVNESVKTNISWNIIISNNLRPVNIDILTEIAWAIDIRSLSSISIFSYDCKKFDACILILYRA